MTISKLTDLEFIVLACDGIFDVMNNTEVIKFVRSRLAQRIHPKEVIITKITAIFQKYALSRTKITDIFKKCNFPNKNDRFC